MDCKWICTASGYGLQVSMDCKWVWTASGYGLQVDMDCKWVWTASGYGLQVGMDCIHITEERNKTWTTLKEAMTTAVTKTWQNKSQQTPESVNDQIWLCCTIPLYSSNFYRSLQTEITVLQRTCFLAGTKKQCLWFICDLRNGVAINLTFRHRASYI